MFWAVYYMSIYYFADSHDVEHKRSQLCFASSANHFTRSVRGLVLSDGPTMLSMYRGYYLRRRRWNYYD